MTTERENMMMVLHHEKPEWVPNFGNSAAFLFNYGCDRTLDERDGMYYDKMGVAFVLEGGGFMPHNTKTGTFELTDVTQWESVMPTFDGSAVDWEAETKKMLTSITTLYGQESDDHIYNYIVGYLWDELHYMMGFNNALLALVSEPDATRAFLCAMADYYIACMERQFAIFKPDLAMVMDHVANAPGLMMSPDTYRAVIKPAEKKIYDALHDYGIQTEIHVDGRCMDILPDYKEMGIEAIQPFQVMNDIEGAKKEYGFIAIGGWDSFGPGNMADSTEEEVRQSVRTAMDAYAPTGDYAFWCSGVLDKRIAGIIADEADIYGHAFYRR